MKYALFFTYVVCGYIAVVGVGELTSWWMSTIVGVPYGYLGSHLWTEYVRRSS